MPFSIDLPLTLFDGLNLFVKNVKNHFIFTSGVLEIDGTYKYFKLTVSICNKHLQYVVSIIDICKSTEYTTSEGLDDFSIF